MSKVPERNSKQWKRNEKIIAQDPTLRAARDVSQGLKPGSTITTGVQSEKYKDNYEKIDWSKK
jgi:hypothetical protein